MQTFLYNPYRVELRTNPNSRSIVYAVMDHSDTNEVWQLLKESGTALASITGVDWNRELSPWKVPKVFQNGEDFSGQGTSFLNTLIGHIIPLAEEHLGFTPALRSIAGYSLAGLFALWTVCQTTFFDGAASISGSLWFDGFLDYMKANTPTTKRVYLSLGDREKVSRNPRLAMVEDCTRQMTELLLSQNIPVTFELNPGGHFQDIAVRMARGICMLTNSAPLEDRC